MVLILSVSKGPCVDSLVTTLVILGAVESLRSEPSGREFRSLGCGLGGGLLAPW